MGDERFKVLVIGTGSIGRRHIANLQRLNARVEAFSYRSREPRRIDPGEAFPGGVAIVDPVPVVDSLQDVVLSGFNAVVIANSTDQHMSVANRCAALGIDMFIEKPLSASMQGVGNLVRDVSKRNLVVECGYMLRLHPNLQWVKHFLLSGELGRVAYARAGVGQWLPDWRPGTDHRVGYGAHRARGGGVTFDLIHEIDLVHWLVGPVVDVSAMMSVVPELEIETEGVSQLGLKLRSGALAQVHLDYVRRTYSRDMTIAGANGVLEWDYVLGQVRLSRAAGDDPKLVHEVGVDFQRNDLFLDHMRHFLNRCSDRSSDARSSLDDAVAVLEVAVAAHLSNMQRRFVEPSEIRPVTSVWPVAEVT